jgi:AcrR family transcriptional regulator
MVSEKESKVIDAARAVFFRYGFKRVTMNDIAEAAGISRPALYLIFPNKEEVFTALIRQLTTQNLDEICRGLDGFSSSREKLMFAFEIWTVRPFELIMQSPDAKDLINCRHEFSREVFDQIHAKFESQLTGIISPWKSTTERTDLSAAQITHLLTSAVRGFKEVAQNGTELRRMIKDLLDITIV